jgi:nicotinate-nucleotide adenylyltransferase
MIEKKYTRYIYPRPGTPESEYKNLINCKIVNAPHIEISSSFIREAIGLGKKPDRFLPSSVYAYIEKMNFYK